VGTIVSLYLFIYELLICYLLEMVLTGPQHSFCSRLCTMFLEWQ